MVNRVLAAAVLRRSGVSRRSYHLTAVRQGGPSPPLAPFARVAPQSESVSPNNRSYILLYFIRLKKPFLDDGKY